MEQAGTIVGKGGYSVHQMMDIDARLRAARRSILPAGYLASAAWDILCELANARARDERKDYKDIGSALGLPIADLQIYLARLRRDGVIEFEGDMADPDLAFVKLTDTGHALIERIFAEAAAKAAA